jgi:Domain of unknown function (DUF4282)
MHAKGFLGSLFDYSFSSFVTSRIVKFLYVLTTIIVALWTLLLIVVAFHASSTLGVLTLLIFGPLVFLVSMTYARVGLELMIVFFRISENVQSINDRGDGATLTSAPPDVPATGAAPATA